MTILQATQQVRRAWVEQGRSPHYHLRMVAMLRKEWPVLAKALDDLDRAFRL